MKEGIGSFSFSGFSVGCCINRECPDDDWSIQSKRRQSFFPKLKLVTDNLLSI